MRTKVVMPREGAIFGWRALIGWIHSLGMVSHTPLDLYQLVPEGFGFMFSILGKLDQSKEQTELALSRLEAMADLLGKNGAEYIIANSSPMVTHGGPGADREVIQRIEKSGGCPATTTTTAAVQAMKAMDLRRVALCSPYSKENKKLQVFLEAEGFQIVGEYGMTSSLWDIHRLPAEYSYKIAKDAFRGAPNADCLYMAGGRLRVLEIAEELEADIGAPVIASTPATVWQMLQDLKFHAPITGYGRLLAEMPSKV